MTVPADCVLDPVLKAVIRRWSASLLWRLCEGGPMRSGVLMRSLPAASVKVLTERLRDLEAQSLVERTQIGSTPSEVTYSISQRGLELRSMLQAMLEVAEQWASDDADPATKSRNGTLRTSKRVGHTPPELSTGAEF